MQIKQENGNVQIEEYSLADVLKSVEQLVKQGYEVDFEHNETYPQTFGSYYFVVMKPTEQMEQLKQVVTQTTEATVNKPGRKPKQEAKA